MENIRRVTFYVDGFNFYFGLKRARKIDKGWHHLYWTDMVKLFESFLGENQKLEKVIYFTASPLSPQKNSRQSAFLNANKLINGDKFEVVRGKYMEKHITCPYCKGDIIRPEEKKTDVNISIRMIADCVSQQNRYHCLGKRRQRFSPALRIYSKLLSRKIYQSLLSTFKLQ